MKAGWLKLFIKELSDKWQIPIFLISMALAGTGIYHLMSNQKRSTIQECIKLCQTLAEAGDYPQAGKLAGQLLVDKSITEDQRKQIHGLLARMIHDAEAAEVVHNPKLLAGFHRHFSLATQNRGLTEQERLQLMDVYRWEGKYLLAMEQLQMVLDNDPPNRSALLKQKLELLPRIGGNIGEKYVQTLNEFLGRTDLSEENLVWAVDLKTELLLKQGQFEKAVRLIGQILPRVSKEQNKLRLQYSQALGHYTQDQLDEPEPKLRDILDRLTSREDLDAKVVLLLGNISLKNDRPEEANSFFDRVIFSHPHTDYHLAAIVGRARSQAILHRYIDSQTDFRTAFKLFDEIGHNPLVSREKILIAIDEISEQLAKDGQLTQALAFAYLQEQYMDLEDNRDNHRLLARIWTWNREIAEKIIERTGKVSSDALAEQLKKEAQDYYRKAGDYFLRLSTSRGLLDRNSAQVMLQAAKCYEKANLADKSRSVLEKFVNDWPYNNPDLPEAMFKLARMYQGHNQLSEAERYYQKLISEYARNPYGQRSLISLAECYFARGPKFFDRGEKILRDIVDDTSNQQQFKPDSIQFRAAMFLLGKLYHYKGQYEQSAARLEEALQRYPDDVSCPEARFLIAQSYRKIAEQTSEKISRTTDNVLKSKLTSDWKDNLIRAQEMYQEAMGTFEKIETRTRLEDTYLQLAYVYYADCLYALGQYEGAIKAYERVIDRYERTSIALDSYVQITNAYQRLGQQGKIKAVLERMKWLVQQLPDQAFRGTGKAFSRQDWLNWIDWNYRSGLLFLEDDRRYLAHGSEQANF